jgi:hypothetical protein
MLIILVEDKDSRILVAYCITTQSPENEEKLIPSMLKKGIDLWALVRN